ncbi:MAG: prepilin-type N-terminal cleavage/methylation domain-containing protein [Desulfobacteraceae bacterium]|jgi:type IV pilus assembly protein PilW|nr:prepilin-type N-terminal cleavage/methylation domain-containing protein [Desulfobacteraceae bacterium]
MKNKECGFTLIELLIAMAIFSMLMVSVYGVYIAYSRTAVIQNSSAAAQQSVRLGLELMAQDIRMAGFDPLGTAYDSATYDPATPPAPIEVADVNKIRITSDRNSDGNLFDEPIDPNDLIDPNGPGDLFERISYELSGIDLRRILYEGQADESDQPLIENVKKLEFEYLDSDSNVETDPNKIVTVIITLEVEEPASMGDPVSRELVTQVYCRNLDLDL